MERIVYNDFQYGHERVAYYTKINERREFSRNHDLPAIIYKSHVLIHWMRNGQRLRGVVKKKLETAIISPYPDVVRENGEKEYFLDGRRKAVLNPSGLIG
jgi:CRISPR/Cas system-associated endonuclease Cas3-HD